MKSIEAKSLGAEIATCLNHGYIKDAENLLAPVLGQRIPFSILDKIGWSIGNAATDSLAEFLNRLADGRKMGGWVIIASVLSRQLPIDLEQTLEDCRNFITLADLWYATDIFGERVAGPALLIDFDNMLVILTNWRADPNRWVRRSVGVSVHLWAKRRRGDPDMAGKAMQLLHLLEPMFEERNNDAVKGIGWGLKTLGKYYPELVMAWLYEQICMKHCCPQAIMLRKALTYLTPEQKIRIKGGVTA